MRKILRKLPALLRRKELQSDYQLAFSTPAGKRVLKDLMRSCYMLGSTFENPENDPGGRLQAFREGERNVVLRILDMMNWDEKNYEHYVKEEAYADGKSEYTERESSYEPEPYGLAGKPAKYPTAEPTG